MNKIEAHIGQIFKRFDDQWNVRLKDFDPVGNTVTLIYDPHKTLNEQLIGILNAETFKNMYTLTHITPEDKYMEVDF